MENRFRTLLRLHVEGRLSKEGERSLIELHALHFRRRVERLPPAWFPGREKSWASIQSLANGAYAHLVHEPVRRDLPALVVAYLDYEGHELSWLYYWPRSACMQWLKRQCRTQLAPVERLRRNARNQLRNGGFQPVLSDRGEPAWVPAHWTKAQRTQRAPALEELSVDVHRLRPRDAVVAVLEAAEAPLTLTQIVDIWARSLALDGREQCTEDMDEVRSEATSVDHRIEEHELLEKVRVFWEERLTPHERALLAARGYGGEKRLRPFSEVAQRLGVYGPERWRQLERRLLAMAREVFEGDPRDEVAELLASVISESRRTA